MSTSTGKAAVASNDPIVQSRLVSARNRMHFLLPQNPRNWSAGVERRAHVFQTLPVHEVRPGNGDSHIMSQHVATLRGSAWHRWETKALKACPDELCHCGNFLWLLQQRPTVETWNSLKFNLLLSAESKSGEHSNNFKHVSIFWYFLIISKDSTAPHVLSSPYCWTAMCGVSSTVHGTSGTSQCVSIVSTVSITWWWYKLM